MAQFPEVDPETLTQAIRTFLAARMNVPALANGGAPNSIEVIRGWAEGITSAQNPSNAYFNQNDQVLFGLVQQQGGGGVGSLLFNAAAPGFEIGQFVYQVSNDTVDLADFSLAATGPSVGVIVALPTKTTVLVQNLGSFSYNGSMTFPFLPFVPDTIYYIGSAGNITSSPTAPSGGYNQEIGYAKNTLQLVLNIQDPVLV